MLRSSSCCSIIIRIMKRIRRVLLLYFTTGGSHRAPMDKILAQDRRFGHSSVVVNSRFKWMWRLL